jgi:O-antigen ligase
MSVSLSKKPTPNFLKIISIFCSSLVPFLVTGPFIPDLIVSSLAIWFLYYTLKNKIYNIYRNIFFYFFISFCIICILSSLLSNNILFSLKASLFYVRIGIFVLLIQYLIDQNKKILDYFYYAFFITFSTLVIDGYYQYFTGFNLLGYPLYGMRVSSFFKNELILGSYFSRLFPLFFGLFVIKSDKKPFEKYFVAILFILIDVLIFLAGERVALFFFNLSTIFIIIFIVNYKKFRIIIFSISLIIISTLLFLDPKFFDHYFVRTSKQIGFQDQKLNIFSDSHEAVYIVAYRMFLDKPILGHGPKSFRIECSNFSQGLKELGCNSHPHNFYLQLLAETGMLGFSFLFGFLCYFVYLTITRLTRFFNFKKFSDFKICLLAGVLLTIYPFVPNGNFFGNHLIIIYSLTFAFFKNKF